LVLDQRQQINILATPEWNGLWARILEALAAFPEARLALAQALRGQDSDQPQGNRTLPPPAS